MSFFSQIPFARLIQVVLQTAYGSQQIRNVFWYTLNDVIEDFNSQQGIDIIKSVAEAFKAQIYDAVLVNGMVNAITGATVVATAAKPGTSYWQPGVSASTTSTTAGNVTGDGMPTYDAMPFQLRPISTSLVRVGQKRFAGMPETFQNGGLWTGLAPTWQVDVEDALEDGLTVTDPNLSSDAAYLMIPKTENQGTASAPDYRVTSGYRLFDCRAGNKTSTQLSRQRGRGA